MFGKKEWIEKMLEGALSDAKAKLSAQEITFLIDGCKRGEILPLPDAAYMAGEVREAIEIYKLDTRHLKVNGQDLINKLGGLARCEVFAFVEWLKDKSRIVYSPLRDEDIKRINIVFA